MYPTFYIMNNKDNKKGADPKTQPKAPKRKPV